MNEAQYLLKRGGTERYPEEVSGSCRDVRNLTKDSKLLDAGLLSFRRKRTQYIVSISLDLPWQGV